MPVAKTKALISCAVTAQLICAFVFAYADCWFSYAAAHFHTGFLYVGKFLQCNKWGFLLSNMSSKHRYIFRSDLHFAKLSTRCNKIGLK